MFIMTREHSDLLPFMGQVVDGMHRVTALQRLADECKTAEEREPYL